METAGKFFSGTAYASQQASFDANDMITFAESYAASLISVEKEKDSVKPGFEKVLYSMKGSIINSSYSEVLNERNSGRIASLDDAISEYLKHQPEEKTQESDELRELKELLKSDSVWTLLRFGYKNPFKSGIDDCEDKCSYDLYNISTELRNNKTKP